MQAQQHQAEAMLLHQMSSNHKASLHHLLVQRQTHQAAVVKRAKTTVNLSARLDDAGTATSSRSGAAASHVKQLVPAKQHHMLSNRQTSLQRFIMQAQQHQTEVVQQHHMSSRPAPIVQPAQNPM